MIHRLHTHVSYVIYGLYSVLEKINNTILLLRGTLEKLLVFSKDFLDPSLLIATNIRKLLTDFTHVRIILFLHLLAKLLKTLGRRGKTGGCRDR